MKQLTLGPLTAGWRTADGGPALGGVMWEVGGGRLPMRMRMRRRMLFLCCCLTDTPETRPLQTNLEVTRTISPEAV